MKYHSKKCAIETENNENIQNSDKNSFHSRTIVGTLRRQVVWYIISLKRKQRIKLKAYSHKENEYHLILNNILTSDSDLLWFNTYKGYCVLNTTEYNYKLSSVIGGEDKSEVKKWTLFNKQVYDTFLCSWMISRKLVDHTNIGWTIGRLLDLGYQTLSH